MSRRGILLGVACSLLSCWAHAEGIKKWHYNGFISQSVINTSDNYFFGPSDDGVHSDFREVALIINGSPVNSVSVSAQLLSRKAGVADDGMPRIDYGFVSWRFQEGVVASQGFSLGRIKVPSGFYNETRESPFGRMNIFVPQSVYGDRFRNSVITADELLYFGEYRTDEWTVAVKTGYGLSTPDRDEIVDVFHAKTQPEHFDCFHTKKWNFHVIADYAGGRFRAAFSRTLIPIDFSGSFRLSPTLAVHVASIVKTYVNTFSLEWNESAFSLTAEMEQAVVKYGDLPVDPADPNYKDFPGGGYLQVKWHATPKWDFYAQYDVNFFNKHDKNGKEYQKIGNVEAFSRFGYGRTIGAAYRPANDWLIMAELHRMNGTMWLPGRDMPDDYIEKQHWDLAAVSVAWRF